MYLHSKNWYAILTNLAISTQCGKYYPPVLQPLYSTSRYYNSHWSKFIIVLQPGPFPWTCGIISWRGSCFQITFVDSQWSRTETYYTMEVCTTYCNTSLQLLSSFGVLLLNIILSPIGYIECRATFIHLASHGY